jgi:hypothetical protein
MLIAASPHVVPVSAGFVAAVLVPLLAEQVPLQPARYSQIFKILVSVEFYLF